MPIPVSKPLGAVLATTMMAFSIPVAVAQDASSPPDLLSETYRDWIVTCRNAPSENDQPGPRLCEMALELRQGEGGQRVLAVALRSEDGAGTASFSMITPFGLKVSEQVAFEVDGAMIVQAPFQTCVPEGCIVQARILPDGVEMMRNGADAMVRLPLVSGGDLQVSISLLGLSAAWNRLNEF